MDNVDRWESISDRFRRPGMFRGRESSPAHASSAVADPGEGGANSKGECEKLLFCKLFPKNCMKLKEFGPGGDASMAIPWIRQWSVT